MPRIYLTSLVEPVLGPVARYAKIPESDFVPWVGGELVANIAELVTSLFARGWFAKFIQFIAGLTSTLYAVFGDTDRRLRTELIAFGIHELMRIIQMSPEETTAIRASLENFMEALKTGDIEAIMASIVKAPDEIKDSLINILAGLGFPVEQTTSLPPAPTSVGVTVTKTATATARNGYAVAGL